MDHGICCKSGRVNIDKGTIKNNTGKNSSSANLNKVNGKWYLSQKINGVGIYAYKNSKVTISNEANISDNNAINNAVTNISESTGSSLVRTIYGVGIDIDYSVLDIKDTVCSNNIANNNATLSIKGSSSIDTLNSTARGGAIYATSANVTLKNVKLHSNIIKSENNITTETGSKIKSNDSTRTTGGGIDAYNSKFDINNTTLTKNVAKAGAGIFVDYCSKLDAVNSTITNNIDDNIVIVNTAFISIKNYEEDIKQDNPTTDKSQFEDNTVEENIPNIKDYGHSKKEEENKSVQYLEKDETRAKGILPQTGVTIKVGFIFVLSVTIVYCVIKIYKNRDI